MKSLLARFGFALALASAAHAADVASSPATMPAAQPAAVFVPASDSHFQYEGRFDATDPARPVVIWQASRIRVGFEGEDVTLRFADLSDQVFFDATVDGRTSLVALRTPLVRDRVTLSGCGPGAHQLVLFKRSEAAAGHVRFLGVELARGAKLLAAAPASYATRMLFIGDSITVGACNEDGPQDQWSDRSTHNAALSYAALTAAAFAADHRNIAVSGMGVITGWVPQLAATTWDRVYPRADSPVAPTSGWEPRVVFVNLGENDNSYTGAHGQPFPQNWADGYAALLQSVRRAYPQADIVALRGGMAGGATSEPLRKAWETAVAMVEKDDAHAHHFVFTHWSRQHPRVTDDRAMADELVAWLRQESFGRR